jgi:hypothetical protein
MSDVPRLDNHFTPILHSNGEVTFTRKEPEFLAPDGTIRKLHYGTGPQPWDIIITEHWGPYFAAGNVLKYIRRHAAKNGHDDIEKARWYHNALWKMTVGPEQTKAAHDCWHRLNKLLTREEVKLLTPRKPEGT